MASIFNCRAIFFFFSILEAVEKNIVLADYSNKENLEKVMKKAISCHDVSVI